MPTRKFWLRLRALALSKQYVLGPLGEVGHEPLYALVPLKPSVPSDKRLLVVTGFHGDESSGPYAVEAALEHLPSVPGVFISFLPLVNPTGFRKGTRLSSIGQDPNRGYSHGGETQAVSLESRILLRNWKYLRFLANDGVLTLHEDRDQKDFYLYTFEERGLPGLWSKTLRDSAATQFEPVPDGLVEGSLVRKGLVFNACFDSLEDRLFHDGVPVAACLEIPGKGDIGRRVLGGAAVIYAFIHAARLVERAKLAG